VISIVQLTHSNRAQVARCLPTVARIAERPDVLEWIVLDNASTDGTLHELERLAGECPKLAIIKAAENLGCGGGRNVIWRRARGELVLSLDSDVEVLDPSAVDRMLEDLARPGIGVVGEHGGWVRRDWSWTVEATAGHVGPVGIVCGFSQLFRRREVDTWVQRTEYGPYWLDDSEFCLQCLSRGLGGWVGEYGLRHEWSGTNGRIESERLAAWSAFMSRWRPVGLDVHPPARGPG
jgi:glycosyltransferase involved in cell wall biosynthesis